MISTVILLVALLITSYTDLREGKIYNWVTYPGILFALGMSIFAAVANVESKFGPDAYWQWWGVVSIGDGVGGFLMCGGAMVVCYVFFAEQVGGGDIKMIAMMGAFLGVMEGLEAMLWAFIIAGGVALIQLIWKIGAAQILQNVVKYIWTLIRFRTPVRLSEEERSPLKARLCLAPSSLAAVCVVKWEWFASWIET